MRQAVDMRYHLSLIGWAVRLHFKRWSRYRADVVLWLISIWFTVGIQATFLWVTYHAAGGTLLGYNGHQLIGFLGIALLSTGIAQSVSHGITLHLARSVWKGDFDFWLLQPVPIVLRMIVEEVGIVWFWPHVLIGAILIVTQFSISKLPLIFLSAAIASIIEAGFVLMICIPSIKWGRWDPSQGLWEYTEKARSVPIGQTKNIMLWIASFGVLQYTLALMVTSGELPLWIFALIVLTVWLLALGLLKILLSSYTSASS
jgi:ABC-type uncharacterized transport system permease subunit